MLRVVGIGTAPLSLGRGTGAACEMGAAASEEAGCSESLSASKGSEPPNLLETDLGNLWRDSDDDGDDSPSDSFAAQESFAYMQVGPSPRCSYLSVLEFKRKS